MRIRITIDEWIMHAILLDWRLKNKGVSRGGTQDENERASGPRSSNAFAVFASRIPPRFIFSYTVQRRYRVCPIYWLLWDRKCRRASRRERSATIHSASGSMRCDRAKRNDFFAIGTPILLVSFEFVGQKNGKLVKINKSCATIGGFAEPWIKRNISPELRDAILFLTSPWSR